MTDKEVCSLQHKPETNFLIALFSSFEEAGVDYAVMRNYQSLPFSCRDTDIDLLISPRHRELTCRSIQSVVQDTDSLILGFSQAPGFAKVMILGSNREFDEPWWGFRLDLNFGLVFKGLDLLDVSVMPPRDEHHGIPVLTHDVASVLGVLKEVLNNQKVPARYLEGARSAASQDWQVYERLLSPMGPVSIRLLRRAINGDFTREADLCLQLKRGFYTHVLTTRAADYLYGRSRSIFSMVSRLIQPSGKVIAFLGADGSGKTSLINVVKPVFDLATHDATVVRHLRPDLLPPLSRFNTRASALDGPVRDPHGATVSGYLGSLFRVTYATLNYVLGYWLQTRLEVSRQPSVVIYDRYSYDMAIDPSRFRISLPKSVLRFFVRLTPLPDHVFCLVGPPELLALRKQELSVQEVERQVKELKALAMRDYRVTLIDTGDEIEACRDIILKVVCADTPSLPGSV